MKALSKAEEIELIKKLVEGDGYFSEFFGKDFAKMVQNIRNDFPIEHETSIVSELRRVRFQYEELESKAKLDAELLEQDYRLKIRNIFGILLKRSEYIENGFVYTAAVEELGIADVIRLKVSFEIALNKEEVDYLVSRL